MLVQCRDGLESAVTDVAFPCVAVPGAVGGGVRSFVVGELFVDDHAIWVAFADDAGDGVVIQTSSIRA